MNRFLLALFSVLVLGGVAHAQPPGTINQYNTICDWRSPKNCVAVNSSGAVSVTGSISASSSEHSTAAAPTYVEGSDNPLSGDLSGHLRTIANQGLPGSIDAGWPVSDSQALDASGTLTGSAQSVTASNTDGFAQVTVTINGTYGGISGIFEQSEDAAVTWYPAKCTQTDTPFSTGNSFTTLTNTSRLWHCPTNGSDAFRVRSTAYSSGTANIRISISAFPIADAMTDIISPGQSIGIDQTTPGTTNGVQTLTGSTTAVTGTVTIAGATTAADGTALTNNLKTFSTSGFYNGTTIDLGRSGDVNNQAAVTGVQDILPVARYNATLPTLTDTRYNALQVGLRGSLHMELWGSDSTTAIGNFTAGADASTNTKSGLFVYNYPFLFNGTTWDRAPGTTNGAYGIIRDAAGNARGVNVNASNQLSVSIDGSSATNLSTNIAQMNGVTVTMGNGVSGTGVQRVTLASDSTGNIATIGTSVTPGTAATNLGKAEDAASASGDVGVGALAIQQSTPADTAADGDYSYLQMKNGALYVATVPTTANGLSNYVVEPAASDNHATIKAGAGQVYSIAVFNNSATINYIRLYNATTAFNGCNSATNLVWEGNIPASASGAGFIYDVSQGISFSTGISICVTGGYGQTNTTSATATAMSVNVSYK